MHCLPMSRNEYSLQEDNLMDTQDLRKNGGQQGHTETDATVKEELRSFSTDPKADTSGHKKSLYKSVECVFLNIVLLFCCFVGH